MMVAALQAQTILSLLTHSCSASSLVSDHPTYDLKIIVVARVTHFLPRVTYFLPRVIYFLPGVNHFLPRVNHFLFSLADPRVGTGGSAWSDGHSPLQVEVPSLIHMLLMGMERLSPEGQKGHK